MRTCALNLGQPINWASPLNRGLVARWQIINQGAHSGGARLLDLCGKNHGTLTNGPTWQGPVGRPGGQGSLKFTGASSQYATCGSPTFDSDNWTLSIWVYPTNTSVGRWFSWGDNTPTLYQADASYDFYIVHAGTFDTAKIVTVTQNTWNHFALCRTGSRLTCWHNGTLALENTSFAVSYSGGSVTLGHRDGGIEYVNGLLDDAAIYSIGKHELAQRIFQDSRLGSPETLNWQRRTLVFDAGGGGGGAVIPALDQGMLTGGLSTLCGGII